ncbi:MAG: glycosyltransferase N-terminal domain-containing protein [Albidovulum sp.]
MARSLALALYMMAAGRGGVEAHPRRDPRPEGRLIWVHAGQGSAIASLAQLAQKLAHERPGIHLLVTADGAARPELPGFPDCAKADVLPPDRTASVRSFLDHWRPDLVILTGSSLPPALIVETHARAVPLVLADVRVPAAALARWRWRRSMAAALLSRFARILAQDADSARRLKWLARNTAAVEVSGQIEETTEPLIGNEAERAALADLLQTRPVWLAVACPQAEEEMVLAAHTSAIRLAHRILLILVPADPASAPALADRIAREGWVTALRTRDEEPDPNVQVFVADSEGELGLWYRLAPVTYMGGTLVEGAAGRNPFEPAALGSAILHGPHAGPYPDAYDRLDEANAARRVETPAALAEAVADLIAPDKAATLAHNAWATSSGGAEVAERVMQVIIETLDAAPVATPPKAAA